jgi:arginase
LLNETALVEMVSQVRARTAEALGRQHFPLIYGGDCSVLLGALPALSVHAGAAGLVFLDGHEDATAMEVSTSGEAANMEIAILLGRTGANVPGPLRSAHALMRPDQLAMLGPRDRGFREPLDIESVADAVWFRGSDDVASDPAGTAREAADHVSASTTHWWLHVDLDVLSRDEFTSCGAEGEPALPGGLTWPQLTAAVISALRSPGCRGWSLAVYNPDLDHDGRDARAVVEMIARVVEYLP